MAFDPANGTDGRVRIGAGDTVLAGINEWSIDFSVAEIAVMHFEAPVDSDSNVWPGYERGLAGATVSLKGLYNVDATDKTEGGTPALRKGLAVILDLYFTRTPFGYANVNGFVTKFQTGSVFENRMAEFTASVRVTAPVGAAS